MTLRVFVVLIFGFVAVFGLPQFQRHRDHDYDHHDHDYDHHDRHHHEEFDHHHDIHHGGQHYGGHHHSDHHREEFYGHHGKFLTIKPHEIWGLMKEKIVSCHNDVSDSERN